MQANARKYAVMKLKAETFWVPGQESWLPRSYGAPPHGCGLTKSVAESLLEDAKRNGHDDAKIVELW